jgi:hypothetical protein
MTSDKNWKGKLVTALALLAILTITAVGQTSASLSGTIQDAQGGVIARAKVTLTESSKNETFETTTSGEGTFSFPALQPGTYTLMVEAQGFKHLVKSGIIVNPTDRQSAGTLTLEVGELSTTVEVVAASAELTIQKESGEQSDLITGRQLKEIAVNGRNYLDLMKLVPGTVSTVNGQVAGPGGFGNFNINGDRAGQNNLTIDGSTNVDTGSNGTQHVALNIDTIRRRGNQDLDSRREQGFPWHRLPVPSPRRAQFQHVLQQCRRAKAEWRRKKRAQPLSIQLRWL